MAACAVMALVYNQHTEFTQREVIRIKDIQKELRCRDQQIMLPDQLRPLLTAPHIHFRTPYDMADTQRQPRRLLRKGKVNRVPVLLGTNHDEGTEFVEPKGDKMTKKMYFAFTLNDLNFGCQTLRLKR